MNESLAKQLHELILQHKINIKNSMCIEMNQLEQEVKELIETPEDTKENVND